MGKQKKGVAFSTNKEMKYVQRKEGVTRLVRVWKTCEGKFVRRFIKGTTYYLPGCITTILACCLPAGRQVSLTSAFGNSIELTLVWFNEVLLRKHKPFPFSNLTTQIKR
jgi:hypothetical protein